MTNTYTENSSCRVSGPKTHLAQAFRWEDHLFFLKRGDFIHKNEHQSSTVKQCYWQDHIEHCGAASQTMVADAVEQSLDLKRFYDRKMRLTQLRILPKTSNPGAFTRVTVKATRKYGAG